MVCIISNVSSIKEFHVKDPYCLVDGEPIPFKNDSVSIPGLGSKKIEIGFEYGAADSEYKLKQFSRTIECTDTDKYYFYQAASAGRNGYLSEISYKRFLFLKAFRFCVLHWWILIIAVAIWQSAELLQLL